MTKMLVTGGAGFIGANFVHYTLKHKPEYEVTVIDKLTYAGNPDNLKSVLDQINFVTGDICDRDLMDKLVSETDIVVHFAAESHNVLEHARTKRLKKGIPMLVANEVSIAMGSSRNQVTIIDAYGDTPLPEMSKYDTASAIVQHLSTLLHQA